MKYFTQMKYINKVTIFIGLKFLAIFILLITYITLIDLYLYNHLIKAIFINNFISK